MNRMHPDDLRALVAAPLFAMNETITAANAVALADSLLDEIASTAKPHAKSEPASSFAEVYAKAKTEGAKEERERIIEHICQKWTTDWFKAAYEHDIHRDLQPPK